MVGTGEGGHDYNELGDGREQSTRSSSRPCFSCKITFSQLHTAHGGSITLVLSRVWTSGCREAIGLNFQPEREINLARKSKAGESATMETHR